MFENVRTGLPLLKRAGPELGNVDGVVAWVPNIARTRANVKDQKPPYTDHRRRRQHRLQVLR